MGLKTLHLTNAWHAASGGIGTFYRSLLDAANQGGHSLRLVVPAERECVENVGEFGRIYHLRAARAPLNSGYRFLYPPTYLRRPSRIAAILNAERPDLIEICDKYTLPYLGGLLRIGKLRDVSQRVPILGLSCERMDENLQAYFGRTALGSSFSRWYMKNIYFPQFDHHLANSDHTAMELREASRGHKVKRGVWVRPMGVDCSSFSPQLRSPDLRRELAARVGGDANSVLLLYVGRLAPEKNLTLLTDTMQALDENYRMVIAGQGMSRGELERDCQSRVPGRVLFLGHVSGRLELARLYASCDTFVHPNPREPFGIAPLEAMASGLPLVAPSCGGITSFANQDNAWLTEPDGHSFAEAVRCVSADRVTRSGKTAAALNTAAGYDWRIVSTQFLQFYGEIVESFQSCAEPVRAPHFYSTPGDRWGREIGLGEAP